MKNKKTTRRQFIKTAGKTLATTALLDGPISIVLDAITRGAISRAVAEAAGVNPRKWVDMRLNGAPPRWVYDLILSTSAADEAKFVASPLGQVATKYVATGNRYTNCVYSTVALEGIRAPYMWSFRAPTATGGTRPMTDLLKHLINIRGIHTTNPGHSGSEGFHFRAQGANKSLPALAADASSAPIAAAYNGGNSYIFNSTEGNSPILMTGNYANSLLAPFIPSTSTATIKQKEVLMKAAIDRARTALMSREIASHPDAQRIQQSVTSARSMMSQAVNGMSEQYASLVTKYQTIVTAALRTTLPGINDKPIGILPATSRGLTYRISQTRTVAADDLRTLVNPNRATNPTNAPSLAPAFAIAEFILVNGFSDSITLSLSPLSNIIDGTVASGYTFDEHFVGAMNTLLINTMYSFAHAACMLELIDRLKAAGIWTNTVINVGSEFNRTPLSTGAGADHGYQGASWQMYSGCVASPMILGNIAADPFPTGYKGTWGHTATQPELNGKIDMGHAMNTVASLLRVPLPVPARQALVNGAGSSAVATIAQGKIIA
jgi:hypothetical protein